MLITIKKGLERYLRRVGIAANSDGIEPLIWLLCRFNVVKDVKVPIEFGITPVN